MGFLNEIKKLFFGASSVAKSAGGKVADAGKEMGAKAMDSTGDLLDSTKDVAADALKKAKEVVGDLTENSGEIMDKGKGFVEGVGSKVIDAGGDAVNKAGGFVEEVGGKVLDAAAPLVEKGKNLAENVGGKILDKGGDALDKVKDVAGDAGSHVLDTYKEAGKNLSDKAKGFFNEAQEAAAKEGRDTGNFKDSAEGLVDKAKNFFDEAQDAAGREGADMANAAKDKIASDDLGDMVEKAKKLANDAQAKVDGSDAFKPNYQMKDESLLDGHDDFFDKAAKFAEGDYHGDGRNDRPKIENDPSFDKVKNEGSTKGFEDLDGDGSDLVDDAIVLEDGENEKPLLLDDGEDDPV